MKRANNKNFTYGFSLLELLIAVSIFSTALVVIYYAFSGGIIALHKGESYSRKHHSLRLNLNKMAIDIRNAIYSSQMSIVGNATELYFFSLLKDKDKDSTNLSGLYKITYFFDKTNNQFLRKEEPYISSLRLINKIETQKQIIPNAIENLNFTYYGEKDLEVEDKEENDTEDNDTVPSLNWHEKWDFEDGLPQKINLNFSLKTADENQPEIFKKTINIYLGKLWPDEDEEPLQTT